MVGSSDEEAEERFEGLIAESLSCMTTNVNHAIHSLKHAK